MIKNYKAFEKAHGLYELGQAVSGIEHIKTMSGMIEVHPTRQP